MVVEYYYFFFCLLMIGPIFGNKNRRLNLNTHKARAHRWRFALAENSLTLGCLYDEKLWLGVCGDWCQMSRIEGAFLSGMAMAGRVFGLTKSRKGPKI
jgi:hypothetical protein